MSTIQGEVTEWPETVQGGGNFLVGADRGKVGKVVDRVLKEQREGSVFDAAAAQRYFGDGRSAEKIVSEIEEFCCA